MCAGKWKLCHYYGSDDECFAVKKQNANEWNSKPPGCFLFRFRNRASEIMPHIIGEHAQKQQRPQSEPLSFHIVAVIVVKFEYPLPARSSDAYVQIGTISQLQLPRFIFVLTTQGLTNTNLNFQNRYLRNKSKYTQCQSYLFSKNLKYGNK